MVKAHSEYLKTGNCAIALKNPQNNIVIPLNSIRAYVAAASDQKRDWYLKRITQLDPRGTYLDHFGEIITWFKGTPYTPLTSFFVPWDRVGKTPDMPGFADLLRFDAGDDLWYLEVVLALTRIARRYHTDYSGSYRALYKAQISVGEQSSLSATQQSPSESPKSPAEDEGAAPQLPHQGERPYQAELPDTLELLYKSGAAYLLENELMNIMFLPPVVHGMYTTGLGMHPLTRNRYIDGDLAGSRHDLIHGVTDQIFQGQPEITGKQLTKGMMLKKEIAEYVTLFSSEADKIAFSESYREACDKWPTVSSLVNYIPLSFFNAYAADLITPVEQPLVLVEIINKPELRTTKGSHFVIGHIAFVVYEQRNSRFVYHMSESAGEIICEPFMTYVANLAGKNLPNGDVIGVGFLHPLMFS